MDADWSSIFDVYASKVVTDTDKNKGAYVINRERKAIFETVGITPTDGPSDRVVTLGVLFDQHVTSLEVSYYNSVRKGANRAPETRMGRQIISWMNVGDSLIIGIVAGELYVAKADAAMLSDNQRQLGQAIARAAKPDAILAKAIRASGKPPRRERTASDFVRNPYVVAAVILRADGKCEMPSCAAQLFSRDDGSPYLEVHHITPLAEQGDDTIENAAALCPACHRELHHGSQRLNKREVLRARIIELLRPS
jgi:hypothetical protein